MVEDNYFKIWRKVTRHNPTEPGPRRCSVTDLKDWDWLSAHTWLKKNSKSVSPTVLSEATVEVKEFHRKTTSRVCRGALFDRLYKTKTLMFSEYFEKNQDTHYPYQNMKS